MKREKEKRLKYYALEQYPTKELRNKLVKLHSKIEQLLNISLPVFEFNLKRYIPNLVKNGCPEDNIYLRKIVSIIEKDLVSFRNEKIKEYCKNSYLPDNTNVTPCGLICDLKFPCYECMFNYGAMSKRFKKASNLQIEEAFTEMFDMDV